MSELQHRIIIDTDPGLGYRVADVDDGLALFFMLNSPEFLIEGITTVYGNTKVDIGYKLARYYLKLIDRKEIPLFKGSASRNDLGKTNPAIEFLIQAIKENPGEIILITLGPLTNIATAARLYPEVLDNIKEIIIMGGTLTPITFFSALFKGIDRRFYDKLSIKSMVSEFNFNNDPIATKEIIEAQISTPRYECGLEICTQMVIKKEHIRKIKSYNTPISQFISSQVLYWLNLWRLNGFGGFFPFDTFCPIYKLKPNWFNISKLPLVVDIEKLPGKLNILQFNKNNQNHRINYISSFKKEDYKEEFLDFLCTRLK